MNALAVVVTVSDRSAAGDREDASGPVAVEALRAAGYACGDAVVVPDGADSVASALRAAIDSGASLVVTTGGTGVAPRDQTPEGSALVIEREVPGIAEELRRLGAAEKPGGMLSRGLAGVAGGTLIVNLPGSPRAVASGIPVVLSVATHVIEQLAGGDHA
ncbi:molybdenum cofactor biosynthesis protein B [Microbacterium sp. SLBN-146]|uniref:MogA/MoaB family molybdenum cofactor biosynthesis protein n=1 Tax=Microbacterium sp. SLBN-146 TaxID=2768457 RepID=UPI001153BF7D|nr:MogA/MoaB family molybdenum cofactor biosynthesis protein [Microbacterium sp. SLBN-146]TQJ31236.1 molybdopterin adenylyltransferase [Microbacterium sp. SLBN-146]